MIKLKDTNELSLSALLLCHIYNCAEEATKLWSTESNVIDICEQHYKQLTMEQYET